MIHKSEALKYEVTKRHCVPSGNLLTGSAVLTLHAPLLPATHNNHECNALNALTKCVTNQNETDSNCYHYDIQTILNLVLCT